MSDCEIIDNIACGNAFKYCRTHKVEPHDCPGFKLDGGASTIAGYNAAILASVRAIYDRQVAIIAPAAKRELKAGDKTQLVEEQTFGDRVFLIGAGLRVSFSYTPGDSPVGVVFDGESSIRYVTPTSVGLR